MKVVSPESTYAYSVGRVRALEARLLDSSRVSRLVEAADLDAALGALSETDYARLLQAAKGPWDYEKVLKLALSETYEVLREVSPDPELERIILIKYDFHNMKALLARKASGFGEANDEELAPFGYIGPELLRRAIMEEDLGALPQWCRNIVEGARNVREMMGTWAQDRFLDREMYSFMSGLAGEERFRLLAELISSRADLSNIETFIRCKRARKPIEFLRDSLLPGGFIDLSRLIELYDEAVESLIDAFAVTDYGEVVEAGVKRFLQDGTLGTFERLRDNYLLGIAKRAKYAAFGPEPLIGYVFARENEVGILRNIFVGKANGLSHEVIRERLRDVYV